ncbi:TMhelix containing protein [Vibrio phage BUCT006]|nr:TMhelix containing protein [Vibrio phage BUCT006]
MKLIVGICIFIVFVSGFNIGMLANKDINPKSSKSTIYTVKCVDDILTGEFVKVNDKYFRPDSSEPTWIPLSQCGLEPKKQTRN